MRPIRSSPARSSARIGTRDAGDALLGLDAVGVDEAQLGRDEPERALRIAGRPLGERVDAVARLGRLDRGQDQAELAVAPFGVAGQAIVALGQLGQDVAALDRDRLAEVARRDALDGGRDLAQWPTRSRPIAAPARMPTATATANMNSSNREPTCGSTVPDAMSTRPKTPSGTIAAARRVRVSRVWNDRDRRLARVGSRDGVMRAGCPARSRPSSGTSR